MSKSQELFIDGYEWPDEVVVYLRNDEWVDARIYLKETEFLEMGVQYSNEQHALQAENAKLREAVEKASEIIVESCGECPVSRYEWLSWDRCAEECEVGKESECWAKYFTGELGVEVKE